MRFSSTRINLISLLSIVMLLISSVVSCAPFMPLQMLAASSATQSAHSSHSQPPDCHRAADVAHAKMDHSLSSTHDASSTMSHAMSEAGSLPCNGDSEQNCCSATCTNVMAFIPILNNHTSPEAQLSQIEALTLGERVHHPQSLYRPPRA